MSKTITHAWGMKALEALGLVAMAATLAAAQTHNVLTADEKTAGYTSLYNGKDLTGWRSWDVTSAPPSWESAAESTWQVLNIKTGQSNTGSLITTDGSFMNFDFKVEWATSTNGNSGIFIRYLTNPPTGAKNAWGGAFGPESQVVDVNNSDGNSDLHRAGDLYDMIPVADAQRNWVFNGSKVGGVEVYRYNQFRIIAFGNHVAHYGNGHKLLEYIAHSKAWNDAYAQSKYNGQPLYGEAHAGSMYFQNHGQTNIHFRDVRIKNLGADAKQNPWAKGSAYLVNPNDTTSGLKENLTFLDNLTFGPVAIKAPAFAGRNGLGLRTDGTTLYFANHGDYVVRVGDLTGRTGAEIRVRGSDRIALPSGNGRVISVRSGSGISGLIGPQSK